jgi:hypothetical protein
VGIASLDATVKQGAQDALKTIVDQLKAADVTSSSLDERIGKFEEAASRLITENEDATGAQVVRDALRATVDELKSAAETAVSELETLFDSSMDRAAGWYKVKAQRWALAISLVLAAALNADSIYLAQRLWADEALRNQTVAAAQQFLESGEGRQQLAALCTPEATGQATTPEPEATDQATPQGAPDTGATAPEVTAPQATDQATPQGALDAGDEEQLKNFKACIDHEINNAVAELNAAGYPIGWRREGDWFLQPNQNPFGAIFGILATALAMSLGSSFWFDLLGKFMNVRMTGKPENTSTSAPARPNGGAAS